MRWTGPPRMLTPSEERREYEVRKNTEQKSLRPSRGALRLAQEGLQIRIQIFVIGLGQAHKTKRLHPALRRPHRKQHLRLIPNGGLTNVKNQFHFQLLIQRLFQMEHAARRR